ncbi:MAG: hypothetical protein ACI33S_03665 [Bacilli bacterium]
MKVVNKIKEIILNIILVVFFLFALSMTILLLNYNEYGLTQFGDRILLVIKEDFSSDKYKKGDLVILRQKKLGPSIKDPIKVGDEAFAYRINNNETFIEFGVVGKVYETENDISFENGSTFDMKLVIGTPEKVYKNIGSVLSVVNSKWGFLFIILVPCFLIFIYQIYELVIEIKFGKEEK